MLGQHRLKDEHVLLAPVAGLAADLVDAVRYNGVTTADTSPQGNQISGGEMVGNYRSVWAAGTLLHQPKLLSRTGSPRGSDPGGKAVDK